MLFGVSKGQVIPTVAITAQPIWETATKCQISGSFKRIQWICQEISVASII